MPFRIRPPDETADLLDLKPTDASKGQVHHAPDVDLQPEVHRVLVALGMPEQRARVFHVTAATKISDLRDRGRHPGAFARDLAVALGVAVGPDDSMLDVARRLRARRSP